MPGKSDQSGKAPARRSQQDQPPNEGVLFSPENGGPPQGSPVIPAVEEREKQIREDYEWCLRDPGVQQAYGGKVVVVHQRKIWGAGRNHRAAIKAALRCAGCPPREQLAIVFVEGQSLRSKAC